MEISLVDELSHTQFVEARMSLTEFAEVITGFAHRPCVGEVRGLDRVGKRHEHKSFEFKVCEGDEIFKSNLKELAVKEVEKVCPEGWVPDTSFSSQGSFFHKDFNRKGKGVREQWARTTIRRWVEVEDDA